MSICALCGKQADLMQSHLVPKLVYRRIKSHPNSRFRSMDNFNKELQDGEKHPMLCHECEEKFSVGETWFANNFLDEYLNTEKIPTVNKDKLDDYILSVAWRILWDDLYRLGSFQGEFYREELEEFEKKCRDYLLNGGKPDFFQNEIYVLSDLIKCLERIANGSLFGYTVYNSIYGGFVIVYYAGLVFVTRILDKRRMIVALDTGVPSFEEIVTEELVYEFGELQKQSKENRTPEFVEKMKKRYGV